MNMRNKKDVKKLLRRTSVRSVLVLLSLSMGVSGLNAALMWNWVSVGEGNTFSGTLTTDGNYSDTLPGTGLATFNVLSFDSWFLNGTNLVTNGPFEHSDWQTVASPVVNGTNYTSTITWSRSEQKLDPLTGLSSNVGTASIGTFPGETASGTAGHAALYIVNADKPDVDPSLLRNNIIQHSTSNGEVFDLSFVATSTVFTPVPEPKIYAGCAALSLFLVVYFRRTRAKRALEAPV